MPDKQRLLELALKGLEAERSKIDQEITDLTYRIGNPAPADRKPRARIARSSAAGNGRAVVAAKRGGRLTAAGRKRLSELAKKRWAANRKSGKTTL